MFSANMFEGKQIALSWQVTTTVAYAGLASRQAFLSKVKILRLNSSRAW